MVLAVRLGEVIGIIAGVVLIGWVCWQVLKLKYRVWRAERALRKAK